MTRQEQTGNNDLLRSIALLCTKPEKQRNYEANILIRLQYSISKERRLLYEGIMQGDIRLETIC